MSGPTSADTPVDISPTATQMAVNLALYGEQEYGGESPRRCAWSRAEDLYPAACGVEAAGERSPKSGQITSGSGGIHYVVI